DVEPLTGAVEDPGEVPGRGIGAEEDSRAIVLARRAVLVPAVWVKDDVEVGDLLAKIGSGEATGVGAGRPGSEDGERRSQRGERNDVSLPHGTPSARWIMI